MAEAKTKDEIIRIYQDMMASEKNLVAKVAELNAQESEYRCAPTKNRMGEGYCLSRLLRERKARRPRDCLNFKRQASL